MPLESGRAAIVPIMYAKRLSSLQCLHKANDTAILVSARSSESPLFWTSAANCRHLGGKAEHAFGGQAEHAAQPAGVGRSGREVVEGPLRRADDVRGDELGAFPRPVLRAFEATLPFHHRPSFVSVGGELGEHRAEIDLAVAERAEPAGALHP